MAFLFWGGIVPPLRRIPNFFEKSTGTAYGCVMEAFCYRHINFKTVFQSASEHAIFIHKIEKFYGPRPYPEGGAGPNPSGKGKPLPAPSPLDAPLSEILNTPLPRTMHLKDLLKELRTHILGVDFFRSTDP